MAGKAGTRKSTKNGGKKNVTKSSRCDLIFPVGRTNRYIKQGRYADSVGVGAGIFMAAVLEYITSEILELAGEHCLQDKRKQITPRHVQLAVRNDEEINKLMCEAMIASGGVLPNVQAGLFKRLDKKNADATATQEM